MWTMLGWLSCAASFASSTNIVDEFVVVREVRQDLLDRDDLLEALHAGPRPRKTSAMPPLAIFSRSSYWPKRSGPSGATAAARLRPAGADSAWSRRGTGVPGDVSFGSRDLDPQTCPRSSGRFRLRPTCAARRASRRSAEAPSGPRPAWSSRRTACRGGAFHLVLASADGRGRPERGRGAFGRRVAGPGSAGSRSSSSSTSEKMSLDVRRCSSECGQSSLPGRSPLEGRPGPRQGSLRR